MEQTGAGVRISGDVAPVHPNFPVPYDDVESAWRDAGFFARRHGRAVRVVERGRLFWLSYSEPAAP